MDKPNDSNRPHGIHPSTLSFQQENEAFSKQKSNPAIEQCLPRQEGLEKIPPDGGWGFFIIVGCFITFLCSFFPGFGFSILHSPILKSNVSSTKIAWIISFRAAATQGSSLFVGPLSSEFGWRKVAIVGGILNFLSFFLSAFYTNPDFLFFSFGFLGGISNGVGTTIIYIVISRYFLRRRGFAIAAASIGTCLASFLSPLAANYLLEIYGYRGSCLIYGGLLLNQCVAGALFQPVEWHLISVSSSNSKSKHNPDDENFLNTKEKLVNLKYQKEEKSSKPLPRDEMVKSFFQKNKMVNSFSYPSSSSHEEPTIKIETNSAFSKDKDILFHRKLSYSIYKRVIVSTYESILTMEHMKVKIISVGHSCHLLGYMVFQMWIPFVIRNAGYSLEFSAWCVSISSVTNLLGRILMSFLSDRKWFNIKYGYMISIFLVGLSIIVFSVANEMKLFIVCVSCWGLGIGISFTLFPVVFMKTVGVQSFPAVYGVSSLLSIVFIGTALPIVGVIHDATSSYTYALSFLGGTVLIGAGVWFLMPLAISYDKRLLLKRISKGTNENV